jgi:yeast amino acid transporter
MAAGEAENPRKVLPRAYKAVFYRLTAFFMLGSLCVGILVPYDDAELTEAFSTGKPGAAASPYVVSMNRLRIQVLPHIVNAMVLGSAFSAGNSYVYCASRSLFGLALEGKAPKIFTRCTKNGVPIYCVGLVLLISLLSFLQVSNNAAVVLSWFVNLVSIPAPRVTPASRDLITAQSTNSPVFLITGHSLATHQLQRHGLHLSQIQSRARGTGNRS